MKMKKIIILTIMMFIAMIGVAQADQYFFGDNFNGTGLSQPINGTSYFGYNTTFIEHTNYADNAAGDLQCWYVDGACGGFTHGEIKRANTDISIANCDIKVGDLRPANSDVGANFRIDLDQAWSNTVVYLKYQHCYDDQGTTGTIPMIYLNDTLVHTCADTGVDSTNTTCAYDYGSLTADDNISVYFDNGGDNSYGNYMLDDAFFYVNFTTPSPTITINNVNNTTISSSSVPYNYNVEFNLTDKDENAMTCKLYEDDVLVNTSIYDTTTDVSFNITRTFDTEVNYTTFIYNITCNDSDATFYSGQLTTNILIDETQPVITFNNPAGFLDQLNTTFENQNVTFNVSVLDDNLLNFTATLNYFTNGTEIFTDNVEFSPTQLDYNWTYSYNMWDLGTDAYNLTVRACDGHTKQDVDFTQWDIRKNEQDKVIDFGNCAIYPDDTNRISSFDYSCADDRCSWTYNYNNIENTRNQFIECNQSMNYLEDSDYQGHFVSGDNWIDFENVEGYGVTVTRINDHKYRVAYTGTDISSITTSSIGELNCNEETKTFLGAAFTRSEGLTVPVNDFVVSGATYQLVDNETFEFLDTGRHIDFFGNLNSVKTGVPAPASNTLWVRIDVDGVTFIDEAVNTHSVTGDFKVATLPHFDDFLNASNHSVAIFARVVGAGSVAVTDMLLFGMTNQTRDGAGRGNIDINTTFNSTANVFTKLYTLNVSIGNLTSKIWLDVDHKFVNVGTADVLKECYWEDNVTLERTPLYVRTNTEATSVGSSGINYLFNRTNQTRHIELWCRNEGVNIGHSVTGFASLLTDDTGRVISSFQELNSSVPTLAGDDNVILESVYIPQTNTSMGVTTSLYIESLTGTQDVQVWANSSLCPETVRLTRSYDATGEIGTIKYYYGCDGLEQDVPVTFWTYVDVDIGESVLLHNATFNGLEFEAVNTTEIPIPPIAGVILTPDNGSNVSGSTFISWEPFSDPNNDTVTYNVTIYNATNNDPVWYPLNDSGNLNVTFDFDNLAYQDYVIQVYGCDTGGLCSDPNITVTNLDAPPVLTLSVVQNQTPLLNGSVNITWTSTDNNIVSSLLNITLNETQIYYSTSENGTVILNTTDLVNETGTYFVNFTVTDATQSSNLTDTFTVEPIFIGGNTTLEVGVCPTDIAGNMVMWMFVGIGLFLTWLAWTTKTGFFGFFGGLIMLGAGFSVMGCAVIAGTAFMGFAIAIMVWSVTVLPTLGRG